MDFVEAKEEYLRALKLGQKEYHTNHAHPAVLDGLLGENPTNTVVNLGALDIPTDRIVGTKTGGRITAFSSSFLPLLQENSEFALKWAELCAAHLADGIRDPIVCYEYLGSFYVQEGNKRVSVLRYFGAPYITAVVYRVLPEMSEEPQVKAYYEFLEFYQATKMYDIQFRQPGDYGKLLSFLGKTFADSWTEEERRRFRSWFWYFRETFRKLGGKKLDLLPGEGLLLWLRVYPFSDLGTLSAAELRKSMSALWENMVSLAQEDPVQVQTEPTPEKTNLFTKLIPLGMDHVHVAFIHPRDLSTSPWVTGHEEGVQYLQEKLGQRVTVRSYFHADSQEQAEMLLDEAVEEGAQLVFTTTPQLG